MRSIASLTASALLVCGLAQIGCVEEEQVPVRTVRPARGSTVVVSQPAVTQQQPPQTVVVQPAPAPTVVQQPAPATTVVQQPAPAPAPQPPTILNNVVKP